MRRSICLQAGCSIPLEFVDPGEARSLLEQAWAGGVVLDYVPVTSEEDLGDGEVLRRVVLFTARGLCVVRGLDPGPEIDPSSIPGHRITLDEFYGWRVDRQGRRVLMLGDDLVKRDPDRYEVWRAERVQSGSSPHPWIWSNEPDELVVVEGIGESGYGGGPARRRPRLGAIAPSNASHAADAGSHTMELLHPK